MIIILAVIFTFVIALKACDPDGFFEWTGSLLISTLLSSLVFLLVCGISAGIINFEGNKLDYSYSVIDSKQEIVALKDNFGIEGVHFLFSGYVNDELKYTYLYDTEYGLAYNSVDAKSSFVVEYLADDTRMPYVIKSHREKKSPIFKFLFLMEPTSDYSYTFYLPEGSVITNYNIDLEG